jgi:hypothetical protein
MNPLLNNQKKNNCLMNKILSLALLSALGVLQACSSAEEIKAPAGEVIPVKVQVLERQSLSAEVPVSGRFTTDDEVLLSFKTGGVIKNIAVNEGDYVRAGVRGYRVYNGSFIYIYIYIYIYGMRVYRVYTLLRQYIYIYKYI